MTAVEHLLGVPLPAVDRIGAVGTLITIAILVITDKLVWHTRLKKSEERADKWEAIALDLAKISTTTAVRTAEVAVGVVSSLPDPQGDRDRAAASEGG